MPTEHLDTPWYSFDYGVLHYIIISTEHAFAPQTPQYNFIVEVRDRLLVGCCHTHTKDLASINRTNTPWVIFAGIYCYSVDAVHISRTPSLLH